MYKSKYEAYSFLTEDPKDTLACDFEILSDEIASKIGFLASNVKNVELLNELKFITELVYHINPTLRTFLSVTPEEFEVLLECHNKLKHFTKGRCEMFVLPFGSRNATYAHIIRNNFKSLSRIAYAEERLGHSVPDLLHDILGILSNYFFYLSLYFNMSQDIEEIPFVSRNYFL
ncbi:hypothetical protein AN640_02955 [Candidatus Epulonipiscium fishelsonii]|uniref:Uncharacterized protein n=1 Tax=Candidatus Epulonipiscium fishelsonii TaxID=77094 RepID=A0ACC8X896_9FIRM|nr:hypothetical protein AN640_02955 [Epulopiscium sp. SCG-D08WGA-EpuloA1]OON91760.1 MAG: hypothetical protein ATN32_10165 [Epulopiscium sp. AS2M-Bin002]